MAKTVQHEDRLGMNVVAHVGADEACPLGRTNFHPHAVVDTQPGRLSRVDPEQVFRQQLAEVEIVLGRKVGMDRTATHRQTKLAGFRHWDRFIGWQ